MSEQASPRWPWHLLERDQVALYLLSVLLLVAAAWRYASWHNDGGSDVQKLEPGQRVDYRVDVNKAVAAELDLLPGIGPAKAARIIAYREAHGPFKHLADLAEVPGLSGQQAEKLRGLATAQDTARLGDTPR
jgi:competence ComEA-like helix-hairpin-helix protein